MKEINITNEMVDKIIKTYNSNKEELSRIRRLIRRYGCLDNGLSEAGESFEQGYNNALEYVFSVLGIEKEVK